MGLERAGFSGASAGVGFGIAVEDDFPATIVTGLDFMSVLVDAKDFGNRVSDCHCLWVFELFLKMSGGGGRSPP